MSWATVLIHRLSRLLRNAGAGAVAAMMFLTCMDVVLRALRHPIPGTYELVGFLGALAVALSLAQTSIERAHIAVDFIVRKLPPRLRAGVDIATTLAGTALFALASLQCWRYGRDLQLTGEVSLTLELPIYPIVYGLAAGCTVLTLALALDLGRHSDAGVSNL
jgi:TRAP-type C4-dicarboxylate transport system permease small subunit